MEDHKQFLFFSIIEQLLLVKQTAVSPCFYFVLQLSQLELCGRVNHVIRITPSHRFWFWFRFSDEFGNICVGRSEVDADICPFFYFEMFDPNCSAINLNFTFLSSFPFAFEIESYLCESVVFYMKNQPKSF